jgi:transcriptional regulator with XRE-family HTH domain
MTTKKKLKQRSATSADKVIGLKIRTARLDAKISQSDLGNVLGVSFQQVQKYEKGVNRASGVRLRQISTALGKPIAYFLEEADYKPNSRGEAIAKFMATRIGHQLLENTMALRPELQQAIVDFAKTLSVHRAAA